MTSVPLKLKLGKLIKSGLQAAGLRQLDLAQHLQISTSAVSQMLNGKTAPAAAHLDKIFQLLNCSRNQVFIMRDLLARIRSGMHELRSPVNEFLRNARKERGLSLAKLASQSKIPVAELRILETCSTVTPSNEQIMALAEVLEFNDNDMQQLLNDLPAHTAGVREEVQEQFANYGSINKYPPQIPVVSIENMLKFNPALEDIKNFVWRNYDQVISNLPIDDSINNEDVFAIVDSGDNFSPPIPGTVSLVVALKNFPETNDIVIVKSKNSDKLQLKRFVTEGNAVTLKPF
ncbi:MAG: helix-turn-helix transcriptional regulator, partial [Victivallaceae bacterium]|nr:helix-turn-helix transcriptional regulator [Victivallaceae bacterium]